jgi:hypothetical protein
MVGLKDCGYLEGVVLNENMSAYLFEAYTINDSSISLVSSPIDQGS